jgi:hypothetical protein
MTVTASFLKEAEPDATYLAKPRNASEGFVSPGGISEN